MPPDLNDTVARATPGDRRPSAPIEGPGGWGFSPSHAHASRLIFAAAAVAARRRQPARSQLQEVVTEEREQRQAAAAHLRELQVGGLARLDTALEEAIAGARAAGVDGDEIQAAAQRRAHGWMRSRRNPSHLMRRLCDPRRDI